VQGAAQSAGFSFVSVEAGKCTRDAGFASLVRQKEQQREVIRFASFVLHLIPMQPLFLKC